MNRKYSLFGILVLSAAAVVSVASFGKPALVALSDTTPMPIPATYGFPTAETTIDGWIASSDQTALRAHSWKIWAGMTSPSGQGNWPIWETWLGTADLKPSQTTATGPLLMSFLAKHRRPQTFETPVQLRPGAKGMHTFGAALTLSATHIVSGNRFDPAAVAFIVGSHPGPGGKNYQYNTFAGLDALNTSFPAGTSAQDRGIQNFPSDAIETKPMYNLIKGSGTTVLPVWRGPSASTNPLSPTPIRPQITLKPTR